MGLALFEVVGPGVFEKKVVDGLLDLHVGVDHVFLEGLPGEGVEGAVGLDVLEQEFGLVGVAGGGDVGVLDEVEGDAAGEVVGDVELEEGLLVVLRAALS